MTMIRPNTQTRNPVPDVSSTATDWFLARSCLPLSHGSHVMHGLFFRYSRSHLIHVLLSRRRVLAVDRRQIIHARLGAELLHQPEARALGGNLGELHGLALGVSHRVL